MAAHRLSSIPELVDHIIGFVRVPFVVHNPVKTLSACALTCGLWHSISTSHIFHTISFSHARGVQRFPDILEMNPDIVNFVHKVEIDGRWDPLTEWEEQPWIATVYEKFLEKFSKLETLVIGQAHVEWDDATSRIFSSINLPTSLFELSFVYCDIYGEFLCHMLRSFPNLRYLSLFDISFLNPVQAPSNLRLQKLIIENGDCEDSMEDYVNLIIDSESVKTISSLEVMFQPAQDEEMVGKLLNILGPSLEVLNLSVVPTDTKSELNYSAICISRLTRLRTLHFRLWPNEECLDFSILNEVVTTERCKILVDLPVIRNVNSLDAFNVLVKSWEHMRLTSLEEVHFLYVLPIPIKDIKGSPMDYDQLSRRLSDTFCKVNQCKVYLVQDYDGRDFRVLSG